MASSKILVIRATGTQGVAVTRNLIKNGFAVHAFVKDANEDRAIALKAMGATLFQGTLDDSDALAQAAAGCVGVFLNLMPGFGDDSETRHANNVLNAAKSAGVKHVVHSTNINVGRHEQSAYWDPNNSAASAIVGKQVVEDLVRGGDWEAWTILRPGFFMTNFILPLGPFMFPELSQKQLLLTSYNPDTVLPMIDPEDIGVFAAAAFLDPAKFASKEVELFGDKRDLYQTAQAISKASGQEIKIAFRTEEETNALAKVNPLVAGNILSRDMVIFADDEKIKSWGLPLGTFEQFLEREKTLVKQGFASAGQA